MTTPADLSIDDAKTLLRRTTRTADPVVASALRYVRDNDLWQNGTAWRGPRPTGSDSAAVLDEIRRGLAGPNLIRTLTTQHVDGVLSREPSWEFDPPIPDDDSQATTAWWDRAGAMDALRLAALLALCGDAPTIRLYVPTQPDQRAPTLTDAYALIAVEVLGSDMATVLDATEAGQPVAVTVYDANARTLAGLLGTGTAQEIAEIVSIEDEDTLIRLTGAMADEVPMPLGGRLTMHRVDTPPLIGDPMIGMQGQVTAAYTMMGRNLGTAGFAERVFYNADRPKDADGNVLPYKAGAGMTSWITGITDADGTTLQPSGEVRQPVPPTAFTDAADAYQWAMHAEARQLHVLMGAGASASGEARRQAAAIFEASLGPTANAIESAARWLIETAYALALYLTGREISPDQRVAVTCTLSAGVIPIEEIRELREGVAAGLLSRARYQIAAGVADTEAEDTTISNTEDMPDGDTIGQ